MEPTFFATPADMRAWLEAHHDQATELIVGFYKKGSGKASITWPEAVDAALSFGWIDSVRRSLDAESYTNRFTPRKTTSNWSAINVARVVELTQAGLMHPAGIKAFEARSEARTAVYAYERQQDAQLDPADEAQFKSNADAWAWFEKQPPSYRRTALHWVVSAKQEATRTKRLAQLIDDSAHGRTIPPLTRTPKPK